MVSFRIAGLEAESEAAGQAERLAPRGGPQVQYSTVWTMLSAAAEKTDIVTDCRLLQCMLSHMYLTVWWFKGPQTLYVKLCSLTV
jgi:hypothetical protein